MTVRLVLAILGFAATIGYFAYDRLRLGRQIDLMQSRQRTLGASEARARPQSTDLTRQALLASVLERRDTREPEATPSDPMADPSDRASDAEESERVALDVEEVHTGVRAFFERQIGVGWGREGSGQVLDLLGKAQIPRSVVRSLECRGDVCMLVLAVSAERAGEMVQQLASSESGWRGPMAAFPVEGSDLLHVFVARPGSSLPLPG
jgi:hypothetical protein